MKSSFWEVKRLSENENNSVTEEVEEVENQEEEKIVTSEEAIFAESEQEVNEEQETNNVDPHALRDKIEQQEQRISQLEDEKESLNSQLLRSKADFDNLRRRTNEEKIAARKYRAQELVESILPVIDNFERALDVSAENEDTKSLKQGMEMVYRQLVDALTKEGIEEIESVGETFDPNVHQAVMQVESNEHESNTVVEVLQKGYLLNGRVIRPAMVKVSS